MVGWIKSIRKSKDLTFIGATTGAKDTQVTIDAKTKVEGELKVGASFECINPTKSVTPNGSEEILCTEFKILGVSDDTYPIQPKAHTDDFLRTIPELRGRTKKYQAMWKIRSVVSLAIHNCLASNGFYQYFTPIIVDSDCEGAGETFTVHSDWTNQDLTVSGQLHAEVGMMSLGKVYTFSPCFRAEKSATKKHLSEFWMVEPEAMGWDLYKTMSFTEYFIKSILRHVLKKCQDEFKQLGIKTDHIELLCTDASYSRVTYAQVVSQFSLSYGDDIGSDLEKLIVAMNGPTFVTDYPRTMKPFYMKTDMRVARCFDLLFPQVGELAGGSEREDDYNTLIKNMKAEGMDMEQMKWYTSTRKWGSVPHSGFGLGFERLLMFITQASKVHDVIPFPVSYK